MRRRARREQQRNILRNISCIDLQLPTSYEFRWKIVLECDCGIKKCFIIIVNAGAADNKAVNSTIFHLNNKFNIHVTHMLLISSLEES